MADTTAFESFQTELKRLVETFGKNLDAYKSAGYDEASLRQEFLNPLFRALGWDMENKAGLIPAHREVVAESRTDVGRADYLFRTDRKPRFVCEAKRPVEELQSHAQQAKGYAWTIGVPLAVLTDFEGMNIYIVGREPQEDKPEEGLWKTYHFHEYVAKARELWDLLARDNVAGGSIDRLIESLPKKPLRLGKGQFVIRPDPTQSFDAKFLNFLDSARRSLASDLIRQNDRDDLLEGTRLNEAVQCILDRLLFIRISEARGIDMGTKLQSLLETWKRRQERQDREGMVREPPAHWGGAGLNAPRDSLWYSIVRHIRALDRRPPSHVPFFNGNLFKLHFSEELVVGDDWLEGFLESICNEYSSYKFGYVAVEILGTIYERFLGKIVRAHGRGAVIEEKPEVRKAGGVYYTPRYIVEYIVEQTIGKMLEGKKPEETLKLRFLDPACGSGSFLLRVFERVCEHWQQWLTDHPDKRKKDWCWLDAKTNTLHLTARTKRRILRETVYGVDIDPQAVEVTQLSLYLKMLEGETGETLQREQDLFGGDEPILPPLHDNIKQGNSLIASDFSMIPEDLVRVHAFDWPVQFAPTMRAGGFDAVVGNPPYIPIETMEDNERGYYQEAYPQLERKYDTGVIFILRALRLIKPTGFVGFISSITWETGENFAKLREVMFTQRGVAEVINLPFNTFADAYVDTGVYILCGNKTPEYRIYRYSKKAKIDSLKDVAPISVPTSLVTAPDFRLVLDPSAQRILVRALSNKSFKPLGELTKSTQGLAADRFQRAASAKSSEWYAFGEQAQAYRYDFFVEERSFAYMRDNPSLKQFYKAEPKILIRRIINRQDRLDACFCDEQMVFKKDINPFVLTAAKPSPKFVLGILNSRLLSYLYVNTSAIATKDDFRQTTLAELRRLPIPFPDFTNKADKARHDRLVGLVDKLLVLMPKLRQAGSESERQTLQNAVTAADQQIDGLVYELYGLTEQEIAIVEGAQK